MDFGDLTSYKKINDYFRVLCDQSKQSIVQQLFCDKAKIVQQKSTLEREISDAFCLLYGKFASGENASLATRISRMFGIDLKQLESKQKGQRQEFVRYCIEKTVQKELALSEGSHLTARKHTPAEVAKTDRDHKQKFGWIELRTKYTFLKETFEEILLEKVREFDKELEEMVVASKCRKQTGGQTTAVSSAKKTTAFEGISLQNTETALQKIRGSRSTQQFRPATGKKAAGTSHSKEPNPQQRKFHFSNVAIRDTTKFTLRKWGHSQQSEFREKKTVLRETFHKTSNTPIIFQFVKKYTQTVKARDHLMNRWHERDDLNQEELRYLCATSVFLNQTINKNQKQQIRQKINTLNRNMLSRLEVNIAEKIIETYRLFTDKVADMRKNYYLQLTANAKTLQKQTASQLAEENRRKQRFSQYLAFKKRFQNICNSEKMKWRLNYRIMRWVKHFIERMKHSIGKRMATSRLRRGVSAKVITRMHYGHPSSKVIKKQMDKDLMHFEPRSLLERTVDPIDFNSVKCNDRSAFLKHLSNGPKRLATSLVKVDLLNKTAKCDATALGLIIYVQACWRRRIVMKEFKNKLQRFRSKRAAEFQQQLLKLRYLYPSNRRIVLPYVAKRLKNASRLAIAAFKPFIRHSRQAKFKYTQFLNEKTLSQRQLQMKYLGQTMSKLASKVKILMDCASKNEFERMMNTGFILSAKELNAYVGGRSVLHAIAQHGNVPFGRLLLDGGALPNASDKDGNSPLHIAFAKKDSGMIFLLLDYGADLNQLNNRYNTPLFYAPRELLASLGLEDGFVSGENSLIDNNQLYYRKMHHEEDEHLQL